MFYVLSQFGTAQVFRLKAEVYKASRKARIMPFKTLSVSTTLNAFSLQPIYLSRNLCLLTAILFVGMTRNPRGLILKTYPIPMVPGPVKAHPSVLEAYRVDYGSADLEKEYVELYTQTETNLKAILQTRSRVVIFLGEGMMALWGALKSCLLPGDRVLAIGTGVYGYGIGDMAAAVGAEVRTIGLSYDETLSDLSEIRKAIAEFKPKMITVVHCETPSGTLNPIHGLGKLKQELGACPCSMWMRCRASGGRRCCRMNGTSTSVWAGRRNAYRLCRTPAFCP